MLTEGLGWPELQRSGVVVEVRKRPTVLRMGPSDVELLRAC